MNLINYERLDFAFGYKWKQWLILQDALWCLIFVQQKKN